MLSLNLRLSIVASIVLFVVLGLTGAVLDRAFVQTLEQAREDRLRSYVYTILAATNVENGQISVSSALPEPRLMNTDSGLYGLIYNKIGTVLWQSPSTLGRPVVAGEWQDAGQEKFSANVPTSPEEFSITYGLSWDDYLGNSNQFNVLVSENSAAYARQLTVFRNNLWGWLAGAIVLLLATQTLALRWSLKPLRDVSASIALVECGELQALPEQSPKELQALTGNINRLMVNERQRLDHYKSTLANLAHSLKTPLTAIRSSLETQSVSQEQKGLIDQIERINTTIEYQLARAANSAQVTFAKRVSIKPLIEKTALALQKVYRDKKIDWQLNCDDRMSLAMSDGDLFELFGNLLENAFKWSKRRVTTSVTLDDSRLLILIEDDGPGIPADQWAAIFQRGVRADESVAGYGIGLSVVHDIVKLQNGHISVEKSPLGGAAFRIEIP